MCLYNKSGTALSIHVISKKLTKAVDESLTKQLFKGVAGKSCLSDVVDVIALFSRFKFHTKDFVRINFVRLLQKDFKNFKWKFTEREIRLKTSFPLRKILQSTGFTLRKVRHSKGFLWLIYSRIRFCPVNIRFKAWLISSKFF